MSTREKLIKARLGMLALAEELQNIRLACKRAGISRSHFYEIKQAFEKFGRDGLAPQPRRRPRMPNQTPPELEQKILEMTEQYPTYSYVRISSQLKLLSIGVSAPAVRAVWQRHRLVVKFQRLLWLEQKTAQRGGVLTESLLHKHRARTVDPEQHVESPYPGYLLCQDTYFVPTIKGVGRIYAQSVVDAHCSLRFAKLALSKEPLTAVSVLHEKVLPFFEEHAAPVEICSPTTAANTADGNSITTSSFTWPSTRSATDVPRCAPRKPTASANASIAPSKRSFLPRFPQEHL